EFLFLEVYKHHSLLKLIVSDRDKCFTTSKFWQWLNDLISTKLKMSSAYHPQSNGAMEQATRMIGQIL
ncbi:hypothetical protein J132_11013, partial [Termitomyces sp. J132]